MPTQSNKTRTMVFFPMIDEPRLEQLHLVKNDLHLINAVHLDEANNAMRDADAFYGKLSPTLLANATKLRWVQSPTASLEHFLFPELIEHACLLTNMRGLFSDVIADHVMGFVLSFARNFQTYMRRQIKSDWTPVGGESERTTFSFSIPNRRSCSSVILTRRAELTGATSSM